MGCGRRRGRGGEAADAAPTGGRVSEPLQPVPQLRSAYVALAEAFDDRDQPDQAAAAYRTLLERFPDHMPAVEFLFHYHVQREEMFQARDYAFQARALKPASEQVQGMVQAAHFGAARQHALEGRFEEGRAELAAAAQISVKSGMAYESAVRRAMLEYKAGQADAGRRLIDEALAQGPEPAVLLALGIEACAV